jgi:hypothetical protein
MTSSQGSTSASLSALFVTRKHAACCSSLDSWHITLSKGAKGVRRGAYAAVWIYESREAWERLWGTAEHPRPSREYPDTWRIWEEELLAPFLANRPDDLRFTAYEEMSAFDAA